MIEGIVLPESVKSIFYVLNRNGYIEEQVDCNIDINIFC